MKTDAQLKKDVTAELEWDPSINASHVGVAAENGVVTLTGHLNTFAEKYAIERAVQYQRGSAEKAVRNLTGVVGVSNTITLKPSVTPAKVADRIRDALARHAEREAKHIEIMVSGSAVTLRGNVDSWAERNAAMGAAWSAPGVLSVVDEIKVQS